LELPFPIEIIRRKNETTAGIEKKSHIAHLDYDKLMFPLKLRKWKTGDRFMPLGMKNFKKVSDFFTNQKFNKIQKEKTWILTSAELIVWVVNHRIDERFKANKYTKNHYILKLL